MYASNTRTLQPYGPVLSKSWGVPTSVPPVPLDRTSPYAEFGPVVSRSWGVVNFPHNTQHFNGVLKRWFVETDLPAILRDWTDNQLAFYDSKAEAIQHAWDAYDIANCCLWMTNDDDVLERPDLMPPLSDQFKTSCDHILRFVPVYFQHAADNYGAQSALAQMIRRAQDELRHDMGWH